jgi:hypothetical protein
MVPQPNSGEKRKVGIEPAIRLWKAIFSQDLHNALLCIATLNRDTGEWKESYFRYPHAAESAAKFALEKSEKGLEVYFCAHLLTACRRIKENAAPLRASYVDGDGASVPPGKPQPSVIVKSSTGKDHFYFLFDSEVPPELGEKISKAITDNIGGDPSGYDLTQTLRVPGSMNYKYDEPVEVQLLKLGTETYSPEELLEAFPPPEPNGHHRPHRDEGDDEPPVALDSEQMRWWTGEKFKEKEDGEIDRSKTLLMIGRALYDAGANRNVIVEALSDRDVALGYEKYSDRRDAEEQYHKIVDELEKQGRAERITNSRGGKRREEKAQEKPEPKMHGAAYRGLLGEIVELAEPHIEGDPTALLLSTIVAFGNAMGRGPYVQIGATKHRTNLYAGIVGDTAKARKGMTWEPIEDVMQAADEVWARGRISSGLSSGEGLIAEVRDPLEMPDKNGDMKIIHPGVDDKRLLVMEGELSQVLKVMKREGNTLSPILRNAWDGRSLKTMVKHDPLRATDPHISIIGHITSAELTKYLTETEMANGLANRFIWVKVKRSKELPFGGEWWKVNIAPVSRRLVEIFANTSADTRMRWSEEAKPYWAEAYKVLTSDRPGLFGAVTARAEAQTLRLSMIYALADDSTLIKRSHIESAIAVWQYAEESARAIFGNLIGDPDADKVLTALEEHGELTRTEVRDLFERHKGKEALDRIRDLLLRAGRIVVERIPQEGSRKSSEVWRKVE